MSTHHVALPVASEDEQMLESMLQDAQTKLFELRKRKSEQTEAVNRAAQLERLKEQFDADEQSLREFDSTTIPAAFADLRTAVEERYTECHGRSGLYGQMGVSNKVNNASTKLTGLLDNLLRRKAQHEEMRHRIAGLQSQVDGDVVRAKNTES
jgi:molecular chaperone DnaK (HSP70)